MKQSRLTILLVIVMIFMSNYMYAYYTYAYDIAVPNDDGITIFYNKVSYKELQVTYEKSETVNYQTYYYGYRDIEYITIPETVSYGGQDYRVTSIGDNAFRNNSALKAITIPNSVKSIGSLAFYGCYNITSFSIPDSITKIEVGTFYYCKNLSSIIIPNSVTSIGNYAFEECTNLSSVTIGTGITNIGEKIFLNCSNIKKIIWLPITPPTGYNGIGVNDNTVNYVPNDSYSYLSNIKIFFELAGLRYVKNSSTTNPSICTLVDCDNQQIDVTIPSSLYYENSYYDVTGIENHAFCGCYWLSSVKIPNSVTSIGDGAFKSCIGLISVTIPNSVTSIGVDLFRNCNNLISINIPNSVTNIGNYAFYGCSSLTSITIPNSVTSLGYYSFYGTTLRSLTIGSGVTSIGNNAFNSTPVKTIWLTNTPPTNYTNAAGTINYVANSLYTSLQNKKIYSFLSSMFEVDGIKYVPISPSDRTCDAFDCLYDISAENVNINSTVSYMGVIMKVKNINAYTCYNNSYIKDVEINNEGIVGNYAFYDCDAIIGLNLANSSYIGGEAFANCKNLQTVTASNNGYIGTKAFYGCNAITTVNLSNQGYVGVSAFENCDAITTVTASNKGAILTKAFYDCDGIVNIELSNNDSIGYESFYSCNALKNAKVQSKGMINNQAFANCVSLETCILGEEVTRINNSAFQNCSKLQQIVIPKSVDLIGEYAFSGCNSIQSAVIGNGVKTISQYAFNGCSKLKNIRIGNHVQQINTYAFLNCSSLPQIEIPFSVTSIENYTFSGCNSLETILIANRENDLNLGSNGSNPLFADCPLDSVYIGGNINYNTSSGYGYSPFYRNTSLRTIHITDKETVISPNEFYGCTGLKNVRIGDGVTTIGDWAFSGCSNLDYFAFGSMVKTIGQEAFSDCVNVTKIISRAITPPYCGSQALNDISKWTCELSVPPSSIEAYKAAAQWKEFFFINGTTFDETPQSGDVNHDGVVDVADVMLTVNKALGKNVANFHMEEADLNKDGEIDVADVMLIVNIMLGKTVTGLPAHYREDRFTQLLVKDDNEGYGLSFDGSESYTAMQMVVTLPEGSVLRNASLSKQNTAIRYQSIGDNRYNVVVWSTDGSCLDNHTDDFIKLQVTGKKGITISDIRFTNEDFETIILTGSDGTPTCIINISSEATDAPLYNLQGIKVTNPQKGVYIKNGKKVVVN